MLGIKQATTGIFALGVLFGTAGIKLLTGKDAKKFYAHGTAAVLRAKDCLMETVSAVQESAADIYAEAQQINEDRKAEELFFETDDFDEENLSENFTVNEEG